MRLLRYLMFLIWSLAWYAGVKAGDWNNPPVYVVSEKVELIVSQEFTLVTGRYAFEYVEKDDIERLPNIFVHFPLYIEKSLRNWREIPAATNFEFKIGTHSIGPVAGSIVRAEELSGYPVPEDAAAAFLTFEIPRKLAEQGFEVTVSYTQSNFAYQGRRLAIFTPWLPKSMQHHPYFKLADNTFELRLVTSRGVTIERIPSSTAVISESPTELIAEPVHRKTIAVQILAGNSP